MIDTKLIEKGGKLWEKADKKRIYLSKASFLAYAKEAGIETDFLSFHGTHSAILSIDKNKVWFNCVSQKFESDKASIQAYFDSYAQLNKENAN